MTLSSATSRVSYTGNGAVDTYAYTFKIFSEDDLLVTVRDTDDVETTLIIDTDYTVTGVGSISGGNVVLVNSAQAWLDGDGDLKSNYIISIRRVRDLIQETDIRNQGAFYPEIHEDQFDILTMQDQQQQDEIDRSVKLPETISSADFDPTLPTDIGTASRVLATNSAGDGFEVGPTTAAISNAATEAANAAASADLAEDWATKIDGAVAGGEYSSKAYAIGGTGVTGTAGKGAAKEWAIETSGTVDGTNYSAKEHATGIQTRGLASGGSSKDWANYTGGTVDDTEYSAKKYAQDAAQSASDAATYAASSLWNDVSYKVFGDSPITVVNGDSGTLFSVDCTAGNVVINLPSIAALTLTSPWAVGFKKTDSSSNTITINVDGTDTIDGASSKVISRQYAGCTLIPDTDGSPDNWTAISYGEVPISGAIVGTSDSQTLSNKTFSDAPVLAEIATPSTPASGYGKIYFKSDGFLYQLNDDGSETKVGAGSGGINYVANPDFESNVSGYTRYDDGAAVNPVDATGGSPNAAFTFARNTTNPLFDNGDGLITKDANDRQGHGVSIDAFTIDYGVQSKIVEFRFNYKTSADYDDGDIRIGFYDVTNSALVEGSQRDLLANTVNGEYIGYFQIPASCLSVRPYFHVSSTNADAYTVQIDNVKFGPISLGNAGTFVSDWESFTPTGSWIANTTYTGKFRRVGDSLEMDIDINLSGAPTSAGLTINVPTGYTIDTAKLNSNNAAAPLLSSVQIRDAGLESYDGVLSYNNSTTSLVVYVDDGDKTISQVTQANPIAFNSSDSVKIKVSGIPITGWGTGVRASEISSNSAIAASYRGLGATALSATPVKLTYTNRDYDTNAAYNSGTFTAPESGTYQVDAGFSVNQNASANNQNSVIYIYKNGLSYSFFQHSAFNAETTPYLEISRDVQLNKGDTVEIYAQSEVGASRNTSTSTGSNYFNISKLNNPAQIAPTEFVGCRYTTNAGQAVTDATTILFEDKQYDSHNAYNTSTGRYIIPVAGYYRFEAQIITNSVAAGAVTQYLTINIRNDTNVSTNIMGYKTAGTTVSNEHSSSGSQTLYCSKGDAMLIRFGETLPAVNLLASSANYMNITKVS